MQEMSTFTATLASDSFDVSLMKPFMSWFYIRTYYIGEGMLRILGVGRGQGGGLIPSRHMTSY